MMFILDNLKLYDIIITVQLQVHNNESSKIHSKGGLITAFDNNIIIG